ncbi:MAG: hypothetical protein K2L24_01180, partial [Opitutales bacterium]|nr:hypothetical protein [Opitutales bacterium]
MVDQLTDIRINPEEYPAGSMGSMIPCTTDPTSVYNNPFNEKLKFSIFEVEADVSDDSEAPSPKPDRVDNPGNVPTAFSLGISELKPFNAPKETAKVINDFFPNCNPPVIAGDVQPRKKALDKDRSDNLEKLPKDILNPVEKLLSPEDGPGSKDFEFKTEKPAVPDTTQKVWPKPENYGFGEEDVQWLTFLGKDQFFVDTGYKLDGTQLLNPEVALRNRLQNPTKTNSNATRQSEWDTTITRTRGVWDKTSEKYLKDLVFAPD